MMTKSVSGIPVAVRRNDFQRCFETIHFAAWAYKTDSHLHADMEHPKYFASIRSRMRAGDQIYAIDAAMVFKTYTVEDIDEEAQEVRLSILSTHSAKPVLAEGETLVWRWRGPKGGGHCIVDAEGDVIADGFNSKMSAVQEISRRQALEAAGVDPNAEERTEAAA